MIIGYGVIMLFQLILNIQILIIAPSDFLEIQWLDMGLEMILQNSQDFQIFFQLLNIFFPFLSSNIQMVMLLGDSLQLELLLEDLFILEINFFLFLESVLEIVDGFFFFDILFLLEESDKTFFVFVELALGFDFLVYFGTAFFNFFGNGFFCFMYQVVAVDQDERRVLHQVLGMFI